MKKLIFILFLFLFIPSVKAHNMAYWYDSAEITTPDKLFFYDITNNGYSYTEKSIDYMTIDYNEYGETEIMIPYVESAQIGSNGVMWWLENIQLKGNYLYQITFYVCASGNIDSANYKINSDTSVSNGILYYPEFYRQNKFEISHYVTQDFTADMCKAYNSIFSSDDEDYAIGLRLWSNSTITTDLYLVGYKLEELGVYSQYLVDEITSVIDNSGYATASSVAQVQSSVNQVQQEISSVDSSIQDQTEQQQQNHEETMDTITNSEIDSPDDTFEEFESFLPENGVITQLITLPISLFQKVLNSINGTCSQYNLGNLLGTNLILPCINVSNYIGTTIWNVIDVLFSGFFVLKISKKMIKTFNSFSSMEEGDVLD